MRYAGRRAISRRRGGDNSFWLCFADLMSALLLIFLLILFSVLYQLLARSDDLAATTVELVNQQEQLKTQQLELEEKDRDLQASRESLTDKERQILLEQAKLLVLEQQNKDAQALLETRQKELDEALIKLDEQQLLLTQQQSLLDEQQLELTGQQQMMSEQQRKLDELVGIKTQIISSLASALSDANVRVRVDSSTGAIALDSSVLFDVGSSDLKESGMLMIDQFLPVYLSVLFSGDNTQNVGEIIVEGHTDTDGTYLYNSDLSTRRALSVMNYILSDDYDKITPAMKAELKRIATATGRSFSHPIYGEDGEIDKELSRRVEFKFRMQDESMIEEMREILESMP